MVACVRKSGDTDYDSNVMQAIETSVPARTAKEAVKESREREAPLPPDSNDELLPAAVDVVLETEQASVSMLQRRMRLGYSRAARLIDLMEARGYVGPFEGSRPRQILITPEQWKEWKAGVSAGNCHEPQVSDKK